MRVTLASAYKDNAGGDTVDLPRPEARSLIARGKARAAKDTPVPTEDQDEPGLFDLEEMD